MTIQNQFKRLFASLVLLGMALAVSSTAIAAEAYLVANPDGTVKDNFTGLTWVQNPTVVPSLAGQKTYQEAQDACTQLVHAGLGPNVWRLPTIGELKSIYDTRFKNPRINTGYFSSEGAPYWSATPSLPGSKAWTLNFKTGYLGSFDKANPDKPARQYTRCTARV